MRLLNYIKTEIDILLFLAVYTSADTLTFGANGNRSYLNLSFALIIIFFSICIYKIINQHFKYVKYTPFLVLLFVSLAFTALINNTFSGGIALQFFLFVVAVYIVEKYPFKTFCYSFERIIYFLSCSSLIFFLIFQIGFRITPPFIVENTSGLIYNFYLIYSEPTVLFSETGRNQSIFREPGVFMMYINIALLFNILIVKRGPKRNLIYYLTLLTTFSTAGITVGILILYIQLSLQNTKAKYCGVVLLLLFLLYVYINFTDNMYLNKIFGKLQVDSDDYSSTLARMSSFYVPWEIFIHNIWGIGFDKFEELYRFYSKKMVGIELNTGMSTNYLINLFAKFGIVIGSMTLLFVANLSRLISKKYSFLITLLVFSILIMIFSNEDIAGSAFFNILIFYGLKYIICNGKNIDHII